MSRPTTSLNRAAWLTTMLVAAAAPALASDRVAALVYAGGEAMPPEAEARLAAWTSTPGGLYARDEVRQQLAAARDEGTLAEAGEIAEPARVLLARHAANERQTQAILAAQEAAERARLAAIDAEAQRQAQLQAQGAQLAQAGSNATMEPREILEPPVPGAPRADDAQARPPAVDGATDAPADAPPDRPQDERPALAPIEVPIVRPSDLPAETVVDKD